MKVKCIKKVSDPSVKVGETYTVEADSIGYRIKFANHTYIMPNNILRECFKEIE